MLILAFDTSSLAGTVAVMEGQRVLAQKALDQAQRSAQTLAPAIDHALLLAGKQPSDVRLLATTVGPGSFTGLRVGVTMAKTLAYALGCDVIGLNTLDVLAAQVPAESLTAGSRVHAVLDAQRRELFVARCEASGEGGALRRLNEGETILPGETWLQTLRAGDVVIGSGIKRWQDKLPAGVTVADAEFQEPQATTTGRLALGEYERGRRDDFWTLSPLYIRPSYAEEKN